MVPDAAYEELSNILFGYARSRTEEVDRKGLKLAHYTSAENALDIISGGTIWLRNADVMNDHSEIEHGRTILAAALDMPHLGGRLARALDHAHAGLAGRISEHVKKHGPRTRERVYMVSLCEAEADDRLGRLSMWRAYGGRISGAALVFNGDVFDDAQSKLMSFASPVLYGGFDEFRPQLETVVDRLESAPHLLRGVSADIAFAAVGSVLDFARLSIKHVGFEEEREWRVIHRPFDYASAHVVQKVTSIGGTPQLIYQLPLVDRLGMGTPSLTLDRLVHRVIVGPSLHPDTTWRALVEALRARGVRNPETRVVVSDIPLRQTS